MNQDPVFKFSEHFDEVYFYSLLGNNMHEILMLFYEVNEHLLHQLNQVSFFLTAENWGGAEHELHRLNGSLQIMRLLRHDADIRQLIMKLRGVEINASEVNAAFKQIQLYVFSVLPLIEEEAKRIELFVDTHYPPQIWNY